MLGFGEPIEPSNNPGQQGDDVVNPSQERAKFISHSGKNSTTLLGNCRNLHEDSEDDSDSQDSSKCPSSPRIKKKSLNKGFVLQWKEVQE